MEWDVCPTLVHMTSSGNCTQSFLILNPMPYPQVTCSHTCVGLASKQRHIINHSIVWWRQLLGGSEIPPLRDLFAICLATTAYRILIDKTLRRDAQQCFVYNISVWSSLHLQYSVIRNSPQLSEYLHYFVSNEFDIMVKIFFKLCNLNFFFFFSLFQLTSLDLSKNKLYNLNAFSKLAEKAPNITVLNLGDNEVWQW